MENPLFRTKNKERNLSKLIFSKKEKKNLQIYKINK